MCIRRLILVSILVSMWTAVGAAQQGTMAVIERRAQQGEAEAQFLLGTLYFEGTAVDRNLVDAVGWFQRAADQGYAPSFLQLAQAYFIGQGVPQDFVSAHLWYNIAAARLSDQADRALASDRRAVIEGQMSPVQLAEAQRLAREWSPVSEQRQAPSAVTRQRTPAAEQPRAPRVQQSPVTLGSGRVATPGDRKQVVLGGGVGRSSGLNTLGVGMTFAGFGSGTVGALLSASFSKPLDVSSSVFGVGLGVGPVWRFKGSGAVTPHIGLVGGVAYAKAGRVDAWAPAFSLTLPLLIRSGNNSASVAIQPSVGGTFYDGEVSLGFSVNVGIAVDVGG
jgi:hypothetical protein